MVSVVKAAGWITVLILPLVVFLSPLAQTGDGPSPEMQQFQDRLAPPATAFPPSQADQGAQVYYLVCMACHGDRGQGLTSEWRELLGPDDQNCWQSRCHASNHPPEGFVFPYLVPALISPGLVARFESALDLHNYLRQEMPWQAPGSLTETEYWQLTAFLLRANGIDPGVYPLDARMAATIPMRASLVPGESVPLSADDFWRLAASGVVGFFAILLVKWMYQTFQLHRKNSTNPEKPA